MEEQEEFYKAKYGDLVFAFSKYDTRASGHISLENVKLALQDISCKREKKAICNALTDIRKSDDQAPLDFPEFKRLYYELCKRDPTINSVENASQKLCIYQYGTASNSMHDDTLHSVTEEEQIAFSGWIARNLKRDSSCQKYLPFDSSGEDLYEKCKDGIILWYIYEFNALISKYSKTVNISAPKTIDMRALNMGSSLTTFQMNENINLAINSARAIGCNVVNIGAADLQQGIKHLLLGLLWQKGLLRQINIVAKAELATLLGPEESIADFAKLSPEAILLRWVNFHLKHTESDLKMDNFSFDVKVYAYLLEQIAPKDKKRYMHSARAILDAVDLVQRAEMVLQNAEQLDCRLFVRPKDILSGSQKLNLAFLANLFNNNPALDPVDEDMSNYEETREEKTYRNWINSMGLKPTINNLYTDLYNGLIIFKLCDQIQTSTVDWSKVHQKFDLMDAKSNFQYLENCNYAVQIGKDFGFSLVGVSGSDLRDGNITLTLAFLWQLMRAYTLSMLAELAGKVAEMGAAENVPGNTVSMQLGRSKRSGVVYAPIDESQLLAWANRQLATAKKHSRLKPKLGFHDTSLNDAVLILDLIDAIKPGSVNFDVVKYTMQEEVRLMCNSLAELKSNRSNKGPGHTL
ncbi:hypothetical protein Ciccas_000083 [Cichlidogyrus casuarinus]|uniref:Fimbrin n=1 Tax=Cichlidogyrus casuarinus TaxID=1844966 RepID=A0ABD2QP05_9PLAT